MRDARVCASMKWKTTKPFRQLLAQLADGAFLVAAGGAHFRLESDVKTNQKPSPVPSHVVKSFLEHDLLRREGVRLLLSDAGHALVRRQGASGRDPFRAQHQMRTSGVRELGGAQRTVLLNDGESPLGWLRSRKDRAGNPLIGQEQFEAGERLRADYGFAQMNARVTSNWSDPASSNRPRRGAPADPAQFRDDVLAAKERVMKAVEAVGPEISGILIDICCELKGLEEAEKSHGWPQRAGKVVLQIALTRLAKHYGLITDDRRCHRALRSWGAADYRPRIDGATDEAGQL